MGSILSAVQVPDRGGDTLFADLVDAYRTLSPGVRALIDPLVAVHDTLGAFDRVATEGGLGQLTAIEPVRHPVVRVHPETGTRGLFVNPVFTSRIEGLSRLESEHLLDLLYEHCTNPERIVRWRWRDGDVAFWDNRATAHYASADYTERRVMHRITIAGDAPVGPVTPAPGT